MPIFGSDKPSYRCITEQIDQASGNGPCATASAQSPFTPLFLLSPTDAVCIPQLAVALIASPTSSTHAQGDGMPLLESDEESLSGRLASQLLRRVSEDRGDGRGLASGASGGAGGADGATANSGGGGWLPLPRFWPQSGTEAPAGTLSVSPQTVRSPCVCYDGYCQHAQ